MMRSPLLLSIALLIAAPACVSPARAAEPAAAEPVATGAVAAAPGEIPEITTARLAYKPPVRPLQVAIARSNTNSARAEVLLSYDAAGTVTDARLRQSSGDASIDAAVLAWAREVKLKPGEAGQGTVPLEFYAR